MTFPISVPRSSGDALSIQLSVGHQLFLLGANGTGKSSLVYHITRMHRSRATHVSAHRQNWFQSETGTLSRQQKNQIETQWQNAELQPSARWRDDYSTQRPSIAIYDLVDAENQRSREISSAVERKQLDHAQTLAQRLSPISQINALLEIAAIPIRLELRSGEDVRAIRANGVEYSVSELSDGERNAFLVAANVLRAKAGSLILIDEPERHLHRSIISPLLSQLFALRQDCAFIVSTHEVMLPVDNPNAQTLLIRSCQFSGAAAISWEADLLSIGDEIDDAVKRDIIGVRRTVLFVEGSDSSLDKALYALLFPKVSVVSKSSCRDVEQAVIGVRSSTSLHWIRAFGIIDLDGRDHDDVQRLHQAGIFALPVYAVEALYYHPTVQALVAARSAELLGGNSAEQIVLAEQAVLNAANAHADRLGTRAAQKRVRESILSRVPSYKEVGEASELTISIDLAALVSQERSSINALIQAGDVAGLIAKYPLRETPALDSIARSLGFVGRPQYESAVLKLLVDSAEARNHVRSLLGAVVNELEV